jgi:hypothetical protein
MVFGSKLSEVVCNLVQHLEYVAHQKNGWVQMHLNPNKEGLVFVNTLNSTGFVAVAENSHTQQLILCFKAVDFPDLYKMIKLVKL